MYHAANTIQYHDIFGKEYSVAYVGVYSTV